MNEKRKEKKRSRDYLAPELFSATLRIFGCHRGHLLPDRFEEFALGIKLERSSCVFLLCLAILLVRVCSVAIWIVENSGKRFIFSTIENTLENTLFLSSLL